MSLLDGLVSHWKCDEASGNLIDAHGSNDLTDNNTVGADASGKIDGARSFASASNEWFGLGASTTIAETQTGDFSVIAWVKAADYDTALVGLIDQSIDSAPTTSAGWGFGYRLRKPQAWFCDGTSAANFNDADWGSAILTNTNWHMFHIVCNKSGNVSVGVDTANVVSKSAPTGNYSRTFLQFVVGTWGGDFAPIAPLNGLMDLISVYERTLSNDELAEHYNSGAGLAYEDFGGGGGRTTRNTRYVRLGTRIGAGFIRHHAA